MSDTIFGRIIHGEIPCHRVFEDEHVLAFMDINPLSEGHVLVIPKEPAATLDELSDAAGEAIGRALPRICRAVVRATGVEAYNVLQNNRPQAGQEVMHVHFHIIPKRPGHEGGEGLNKSWSPRPAAPDRLEDLATRIAREIA